MKVSCPHCGQHIAAPDDFAGKIVPCPSCAERFELPKVSAPPPAPPLPAEPAAKTVEPPAKGPEAAPANPGLRLKHNAAEVAAPPSPPLLDPPLAPPIPKTSDPPVETKSVTGSSENQPDRPSKVADTLAYAILFVPALVVWKVIGGLPGLFVAALIIFLFRGALAGMLQAIGGMFGGIKVDRAKENDLKELLPTGGALLLLLLFMLFMWKPWSSRERYTYLKDIQGKR